MVGHNSVYKGIKLILLGLVILANEIYFNYNWWLLFGSLFILAGIMQFFRKISSRVHIRADDEKTDKKSQKRKK